MSIVRWNLKEAAGKALARRTGIAYEAVMPDEEAHRGRNVARFIEEDLNPLLRGWINYFQLAEVKGIFEELDGWTRRKLRSIIWRQWKRNFTRAKKLMKRGLTEERAWKSATNGRGPWWNSGASHMNDAFRKSYFDNLGLVSLLDRLHQFQRAA